MEHAQLEEPTKITQVPYDKALQRVDAVWARSKENEI